MSATYIVTAHGVRAVVGTEARFIEHGAMLPAGVRDADVERWLGKGLIEAMPEVADETTVEVVEDTKPVVEDAKPVVEDAKAGAPAKPSSK